MIATVAVIVAAVASIAHAQSIYSDAPYSSVLSTIPGISFVTSTPSMANDTSVYFSSFAWPSNRTAQQADYVSVPVATMALCVAVQPSAAINVSYAPTMTEIGNLLLGTSTGSAWLRSDWTSSSRVSKVYWATSSSPPLLNSLKTWRGSPFTSATAFPAAVSSNAFATILATDAAVAVALAADPAGVALMPMTAAVQAKFSCLSVTTPTSSGGTVVVVPQLQASWASLITVSSPALTATCPVGAGCYPLLGTLVAHVRRRTSMAECNTSTSLLSTIFTFTSPTSSIAAPLRRWSMLQPPTATQIATLQTLTSAACMPETVVVRGAGGVTPQTAFNDWFYQYYVTMNGTVFVNYNGTSAGDGLTAMENRAVNLGGGTTLSATDRAAYPTLHTLPAVGTSIALVVNIGKPVPVTLPRCGITSIFNGTIQWWNDTSIQAVNPMTLMPQQLIDVTIRIEPAATTEMLMAGLRWLDKECFGATVISPTALIPNITRASRFTGNAAVANHVVATPYSITWVSSDYATNNNLNQASIQAADGSLTSASKTDVQTAIAGGVFNPVTSDYVFTQLTNAYPFVGIFSFIVELNGLSGCDKYKAAADFMIWALSSPTAVALAIADQFQPLSDAVRGACVDFITLDTVCMGAVLYPQPPASASVPTWVLVVIVIVSLCVVALCTIVAVRSMQSGGRDNRYAPKDESRPVAIAFTDIQNSTGLWALEPEAMSKALDDHHVIIRRVIAKHGCYEVKTAGDSFMVAASTADALAKFAMDVQLEFYRHDWQSTIIDDAYEALLSGFDINGNDVRSAQVLSMTSNRKLWSGLRVRIGLQIGTVSVAHDQVTTGYDYYGSPVNEAARIEALAHGGQTCASAEFVNSLSADVRQEYSITDKGLVPLRGVPAPVQVFQLLPQQLKARVFPALRIDADDDNNEEAEELVLREVRSTSSRVTADTGSTANNRTTDVIIASTLRITLMSCDADFRAKALKTFGKRLGVTFPNAHDAHKIEVLSRRLGGMVSLDVKRRGGAGGTSSLKSSVKPSPGTHYLEPHLMGSTPTAADALPRLATMA